MVLKYRLQQFIWGMWSDYLPPGPRAGPHDTSVIGDWAKAQGAHAAHLARVPDALVRWMTGSSVARKVGGIGLP